MIHIEREQHRAIFSISFFLLFSFNTYSQFDHIYFKNDFEREVLTNPDKHNPIDILLAISENGSYDLSKQVTSRIENLKAVLSDKRFEKKTEEKQLKIIFDLTHKELFEKYKEIANFDEIFHSKVYNCVSATALYCILLDEYSIPYSIKESPSHVYSIAYPDTKSIVLESTVPRDGYYSPDNSSIQKAVNSLVKLKYYTKEEVDAKGVHAVYNEFFYSEDEIQLNNLAGLQYYNEALTLFSEEKYKEALNSNYKSSILYPSKRNEYLSLILLAHILDNTHFNTFEDIPYFAQYANLSISDKNEILNNYSAIVNNRLFVESKVSLTDSIYNYLKKNLQDTTLLHNISEIHYTSFARFYAQKSDYHKSLEYSREAYELNPDNVNTQSLITQSLILDFGRRTGSPGTIKKMDERAAMFPFLNENSLYQSLYFYTYANNSLYHLHADDIAKGLEYLKKMESLIEKFSNELKYDENQYGMVYAEAGAAYFRKHQYKQAKAIIETGLGIIPDHPELKVRLEIVIDEMK